MEGPDELGVPHSLLRVKVIDMPCVVDESPIVDLCMGSYQHGGLSDDRKTADGRVQTLEIR